MKCQLLWRCSNVQLLSLFLLIAPTFLISMECELPQATQKMWYEESDEVLRNQLVEGTSLLEMKWAYEKAPQMVKDCIYHLNHPDFYDSPGYRFLVLYGKSGCGKSVLAKAIAQYAGWDLVLYKPKDVQGTERGRGAEKLRDIITGLENRGTPTVAIFEEFNQFLENAESKYHDNDATSKEFWTMLDTKLPGNNNLFLVCTANRLHKIPQQLKTRIKPYTCKMMGAQTLEEKKESLLRHMITAKTKVDPNSHKFLASILSKHVVKEEPKKVSGQDTRVTHWDYRDYKSFFEVCKIVYREPQENKHTDVMVFDETIEKEAHRRIMVFEKDAKYDTRELTDEERQDLYQGQNMKLQLKIQEEQKHTAFGVRASGLRSKTAQKIFDEIATVDQQDIIEEENSKKKQQSKDDSWL